MSYIFWVYLMSSVCFLFLKSSYSVYTVAMNIHDSSVYPYQSLILSDIFNITTLRINISDSQATYMTGLNNLYLLLLMSVRNKIVFHSSNKLVHYTYTELYVPLVAHLSYKYSSKTFFKGFMFLCISYTLFITYIYSYTLSYILIHFII